MTIGEKIAHLRDNSGISQEQLAEKLSVSEKSVDNALGRIRKKIKGNDSR